MNPEILTALALLALGCVSVQSWAPQPPNASGTRWKVHDPDRPAPKVVTPAPAALPTPPPSDAQVLFDGTDLEHFRAADGGPARWSVEDGAVVAAPGAGSLVSKDSFGDVQLHIEWASPAPPHGEGQDRGNSGVYFMELYEVQVLDSFESPTYPDGLAAAIYAQYPPLGNACRPPGEWQSFDIAFRRPRFTEDGALEQPARLTVFHNGVLVQNNEELWGGTSWLSHHPYQPHADRLPLSLQDHGHPVRYRNIWVRQLEPRPPAPPAREATLTLSPEELDRYTGEYRQEDGDTIFSIRRNDGELSLHLSWKPVGLVLQPKTRTESVLRDTAASVTFEFQGDGPARALIFQLGPTRLRAVR